MRKVLITFPSEELDRVHIDMYRTVRERISFWVNLFSDTSQFEVHTLLADKNASRILKEHSIEFKRFTILSKDDYDFLERQKDVIFPYDEEFLKEYPSVPFIELVGNTVRLKIKTRDVQEYIVRRKKRIIDYTEKSFKELYKQYDIVLQFIGSRKLYPYISSVSDIGDGVIAISQPWYKDGEGIKYSGVQLSRDNLLKILRGE